MKVVQVDYRIPVGLADLVTRLTAYDVPVASNAVHYGVPSPSATVIVALDAPLDVGWADHSGTRDRFWLLASGLHTVPALIRTNGSQRGLQLDLSPAGCRVLLGVPAAAIARGLVDHGELPTGITADLHERLQEATDWGERVRLLTSHLLAVASRSRDGIPDDLSRAWRVLVDRQGQIRAGELAVEVGWSRRHLVNRFTSEFGMPPREVARLHRFGRAMTLSRRGHGWGDVAAHSGYADQSHLSREFRALTGQTPGQWRAEQFPSVQDTPGGVP